MGHGASTPNPLDALQWITVMHPAVVHLYPEPHQLQMVKPQTLPAHWAQTGKASDPIHQVCPETRERRSHRTKTSIRVGIRPNRQALAHKQYHPGWIGIHNHHLLVTISISTHPPLSRYKHPPPPPPPQQHIPQPSQIIVQQDSDTAAALQQMAQLNQQHFKTRQKLSRTLPVAHPSPPP